MKIKKESLFLNRVQIGREKELKDFIFREIKTIFK